MKKLAFLLAGFCMAFVYSAAADGFARVVKAIPEGGSDVAVTVKFGNPDKAIEPVAIDISGLTATNGTLQAFTIREGVTNVVLAAKDCASTNTVTVSDFRSYLYGSEPLYIKFSAPLGGKVTVYAKRKE